MPKSELPGFLKKRKLLYEIKDKETIAKYGDMFLQANYIDDALDFYERASYTEGFNKIRDIAKRDGNLYLYRKICKITRSDPDPLALNEIGLKAMELGKLTVAFDAFQSTKNEVMLHKVKTMLGTEKTEEDTK